MSPSPEGGPEIAKRSKRASVEFRGDLQADIMAVVWKLGPAKVEDVRQGLPRRKRPAYTTVQTVMNRLAERGLLKRRQVSNAFVYEACYQEADLLARSINDRLALASPEARRTALLSLVGDLESDDLSEVARIAAQIRRERER